MFLKYFSLTYTLPNMAMEKILPSEKKFLSSLLFMSIINEHNPSHEYATLSIRFLITTIPLVIPIYIIFYTCFYKFILQKYFRIKVTIPTVLKCVNKSLKYISSSWKAQVILN